MTASAFQKTGWHWTRKGWKRTPKRLQSVTKATKRRPLKKVMILPAERDQLPTFAEARKLAAEKIRAESAPTLAPEREKRATRPPRMAWSGKYADLPKPTEAGS